MDQLLISSFAIIIFSACIHASFQLSVSVLTLLSSHSLGKQTAQRKTVRLMRSFIAGALMFTGLLLAAFTYLMSLHINHAQSAEQFIAAIVCGMMFGIGVATWAFYYRRGDSTALWLPRGFADYLSKRSKATGSSAEAFALGLTSVFTEIVFIIGPISAASLAIVVLPAGHWQLLGVGVYSLITVMPLLLVRLLVSRGGSVARIQQWRVEHKRFLQFAAGSSLFVLGCFLFVDRVIGISVYGVLW